MNLRIHEPGRFGTTSVGRVFVIRYHVQTTLEMEQRIAADYAEHCRAIEGRGVVLAINDDFSPLPLPPVDVRALWREVLAAQPRVEAFAIVNGRLIGLAAAALTNLLEHTIDPGLGVRFRTFTKLEAAVAWLESIAKLDASAEAVIEQVKAMQA